MCRITIICEGETEREFCRTVLSEHFAHNKIFIYSPIIVGGGGIVTWKKLKKQIENHLKHDKTAFVSLLIDFYGIYQNHGFPEWEKAQGIKNRNEHIVFLEQEMFKDIDEELRYRFIPYIQLHEFETLLFNDINVFKRSFDVERLKGGIKELEEIFNKFGTNPELINNTKENAPSKRLERTINGYNKIIDGNRLAKEIGLSNMRSKCPHFDNWITGIERLPDNRHANAHLAVPFVNV